MSISAVNVHRYGGFNSTADLGCEIKIKQTIREVGGGQNPTGKPPRPYVWKTKAIGGMEMKGITGKRKVKMMSQRKCSLSFIPPPDGTKVYTTNFKVSPEINTHS